jgi:hypothetical protein
MRSQSSRATLISADQTPIKQSRPGDCHANQRMCGRSRIERDLFVGSDEWLMLAITSAINHRAGSEELAFFPISALKPRVLVATIQLGKEHT